MQENTNHKHQRFLDKGLLHSDKNPTALLLEFDNLPAEHIQRKIDHFFLPYSPFSSTEKCMQFNSQQDLLDEYYQSMLKGCGSKKDDHKDDVKHSLQDITENIEKIEKQKLGRLEKRGWNRLDAFVRNPKGDVKIFNHVIRSFLAISDYNEFGYRNFRK